MAVCTPVIVVLRSATICEIETFMTLLSRTITNWAAARIAIGSQLVRIGRPSYAVVSGWFGPLRTGPVGAPTANGLSSGVEGPDEPDDRYRHACCRARGDREGAGTGGTRPAVVDPRRCRREPQSLGRERRPARYRQGLRRVPDGPRPRRGR